MKNANNLSRSLVHQLLERIEQRVERGQALTGPELRTVLEIFKSQGQQERSLTAEQEKLKGVPTDKLDEWYEKMTTSRN